MDLGVIFDPPLDAFQCHNQDTPFFGEFFPQCKGSSQRILKPIGTMTISSILKPIQFFQIITSLHSRIWKIYIFFILKLKPFYTLTEDEVRWYFVDDHREIPPWIFLEFHESLDLIICLFLAFTSPHTQRERVSFILALSNISSSNQWYSDQYVYMSSLILIHIHRYDLK